MFDEHFLGRLYIIGVFAWALWMAADKDRRQTFREMNDFFGDNQRKAGRAIAKAGVTGYRIFRMFRR